MRECHRPSPPQKALVVAAAVLFITLVGYIDYVTGVELRVYPLYFIPVAVTAWWVGLPASLLLSVLAIASWWAANSFGGLTFSSPLIWVLNGAADMISFSVVAGLITFLKRSHDSEHNLARVDSLTGLSNSRAFHEAAALEIERQKRHSDPLTIAYIDLDNFKLVNDRFGHQAGNSVLSKVAESLRMETRDTDVLARLGGDEFAVLLPRTDSSGAGALLARIAGEMAVLMAEKGWPVTMSIGAVTFLDPPESVDELIGRADAIMYRVKAGGKNAIRLELYSTADEERPRDPDSGRIEGNIPSQQHPFEKA